MNLFSCFSSLMSQWHENRSSLKTKFRTFVSLKSEMKLLLMYILTICYINIEYLWVKRMSKSKKIIIIQAVPRFCVDKMMTELLIWPETQPPHRYCPFQCTDFVLLNVQNIEWIFISLNSNLYHIQIQFFGMLVSTNRQTKRKIVWKIVIIVFASIVSSILKPLRYCRKILKFSFTHTFSFKQNSTKEKNRFISHEFWNR